MNYRKQNSPSLKYKLPETDFRLQSVSTRYPCNWLDGLRSNPQKGCLAFPWGSRNIWLIVTSEIPETERNAVWLMFSTIQPKVKYGIDHYQGKLDEMSSAINQLVFKYRDERIIDMPYTVEDYRKEMEKNVLRSITPKRLFEFFPPVNNFSKVLLWNSFLRGLRRKISSKELLPIT